MSNYVVIMAGGVGSRLWPMSKTDYPKQFHDVLGVGKSLLQLTVERFEKICPIEHVFIVTSHEYFDLVKKQLPELKDDQILLEPSRKNTAPCIAYAAFKIHQKDADANIIVAPSDHLILKQEAFEETIQLALQQAENGEFLITIGIKPSRPDTGYGYIQFTDDSGTVSERIKKVKTFTEKPGLDLAEKFIESGDFYWNSGIFVWRSKSIIDAFSAYLPELFSLFNADASVYNTSSEKNFINKIYPLCKSISIDFGIMEKADNVLVILADLGWSDLGTWGSLYEHIPHDEKGNAKIGDRVLTYDCKDNIIVMPKDKPAVIEGLMDYIVVENESVLLICKRNSEQKIKQFVNDIKTKDWGKNLV